MAVFMFIVLVSFLSTTSGQGSHNQMRGNRDISSSDVVKEGIMHIKLTSQPSFSIVSLRSLGTHTHHIICFSSIIQIIPKLPLPLVISNYRQGAANSLGVCSTPIENALI
jgi:hypothetical protein